MIEVQHPTDAISAPPATFNLQLKKKMTSLLETNHPASTSQRHPPPTFNLILPPNPATPTPHSHISLIESLESTKPVSAPTRESLNPPPSIGSIDTGSNCAPHAAANYEKTFFAPHSNPLFARRRLPMAVLRRHVSSHASTSSLTNEATPATSDQENLRLHAKKYMHQVLLHSCHLFPLSFSFSFVRFSMI